LKKKSTIIKWLSDLFFLIFFLISFLQEQKRNGLNNFLLRMQEVWKIGIFSFFFFFIFFFTHFILISLEMVSSFGMVVSVNLRMQEKQKVSYIFCFLFIFFLNFFFIYFILISLETVSSFRMVILMDF
jgi:hypothetical protein